MLDFCNYAGSISCREKIPEFIYLANFTQNNYASILLFFHILHCFYIHHKYSHIILFPEPQFDVLIFYKIIFFRNSLYFQHEIIFS